MDLCIEMIGLDIVKGGQGVVPQAKTDIQYRQLLFLFLQGKGGDHMLLQRLPQRSVLCRMVCLVKLFGVEGHRTVFGDDHLFLSS